MEFTYNTNGVCAQTIKFEIVDDTVQSVKFIGGCSGNLQAMSRLVNGKHIDEVIAVLKGIKCQADTSCGDQLAKALIDYKEKHNIK